MISVMLWLVLLTCLFAPAAASAATVNVAVPSFSMSLVVFMAAMMT